MISKALTKGFYKGTWTYNNSILFSASLY